MLRPLPGVRRARPTPDRRRSPIADRSSHLASPMILLAESWYLSQIEIPHTSHGECDVGHTKGRGAGTGSGRKEGRRGSASISVQAGIAGVCPTPYRPGGRT
ncbi:hypothetical protein Manayef4_18865 [Frankia sp. CgMI4]|nr:hypothetical protein Manayef4_18865 [Frankia sp. CgIM4]